MLGFLKYNCYINSESLSNVVKSFPAILSQCRLLLALSYGSLHQLKFSLYYSFKEIDQMTKTANKSPSLFSVVKANSSNHFHLMKTSVMKNIDVINGLFSSIILFMRFARNCKTSSSLFQLHSQKVVLHETFVGLFIRVIFSIDSFYLIISGSEILTKPAKISCSTFQWQKLFRSLLLVEVELFKPKKVSHFHISLFCLSFFIHLEICCNILFVS